MIKMTTSKARKDFAGVIEGAQKGQRILLHKHKKKVAAIVSIQDLALLQAIEDRRDARAAEAALAEIETTGTVPWEQVKRELGL